MVKCDLLGLQHHIISVGSTQYVIRSYTYVHTCCSVRRVAGMLGGYCDNLGVGFGLWRSKFKNRYCRWSDACKYVLVY